MMHVLDRRYLRTSKEVRFTNGFETAESRLYSPAARGILLSCARPEFSTSPSFNPMDDRIGTNINGPSLIRVPAQVWPQPLGRYYLYFSHHKGAFIRLAYADDLSVRGKFTAGGYWMSRVAFCANGPARTAAGSASQLGRVLARRISIRSRRLTGCAYRRRKSADPDVLSWTAGQRRPKNLDSLL